MASRLPIQCEATNWFHHLGKLLSKLISNQRKTKERKRASHDSHNIDNLIPKRKKKSF